MKIQPAPFNLDLLILHPEHTKYLIPITALDIFEASTRNFHPQGLYSVEIFGKVGDERRNRTFAYINFKVPVFHPVVYKTLGDLKQVYVDIMAGKEFAIWDDTLKDFIKSSPMEGETGYSFFLSHFDEIKFPERESTKREFNIKLIDKYRDDCLMDKLLVMPAGVRDYEVDAAGKPSENEINDFYKKVIGLSSLITDVAIKMNPESSDLTRYQIQLTINALYDYIRNLLDGKKKLILGKVATRAIFNGTRNVITSLQNETDRLDDPKTVTCNQTVVGLYQYMKATLPVTMYSIRNNFLNNVFTGPDNPAYLVNRKTLKKELVHIDPKYYDEWMTNEGLEKVIQRYGEEELRHMTLIIDGHYVGLIYRGPDQTFRLFQDIDELPEGFDKKHVTPITFTELLYAAVFEESKTIPGFVTRYPITGYGSIYPSWMYLKTTVKGETRYQLDEQWNKTDICALQFPITGLPFVNSMSPANTNIARLGADFDGDTCSLICVYSEEAKEEIHTLLNSKKYYVGADGRMNFSAASDIIKYVLVNMTS